MPKVDHHLLLVVRAPLVDLAHREVLGLEPAQHRDRVLLTREEVDERRVREVVDHHHDVLEVVH